MERQKFDDDGALCSAPFVQNIFRHTETGCGVSKDKCEEEELCWADMLV